MPLIQPKFGPEFGAIINHDVWTSLTAEINGLKSGTGGGRSLAKYGVQPSLTLNQTTAIQAALDADPGPLVFPPGYFIIDQIKISRKNGILGAGVGPMAVGQYGGTHFNQPNGLNVHAIVTDEVECPPATEWLHWVRLENFILSKNYGTRTTDTLGNGIHISQRIGEGMRCEHLIVQGFPGHGIAALNGSTPMWWTDLHPMLNGGAGIYMYRGSGAGVWDGASLNHVSGDGNGWAEADQADTCLIRVEGGGNSRDTVRLVGIKSETAGSQRNTIHLKEIGGAHFDIGPLSHLWIGGGSVGACIRLTGVAASTAMGRVTWHNVRGSGLLLDDVGNSNTIAVSIERQFGIYSWKDAIIGTFDPSGLVTQYRVKPTLTINVTDNILSATAITGAMVVSLLSINAAPGTQTTASAANMYAEHHIGAPGDGYTLYITNTGAGVFTLAPGTGVTCTGTMTIAQNTTRMFLVTFTSSTEMVIENKGSTSL